MMEREVLCGSASAPRRRGSRIRQCMASTNTDPPTPTRCLILDTWRSFETLDTGGRTRILIKLLDEPYLRLGEPGHVEAIVPTVVARPGVFTVDDPDVPLYLTVSVAQTSSTSFDFGRLELTAISPEASIWIREIHGTIDLRAKVTSGNPYPLRLRVDF